MAGQAVIGLVRPKCDANIGGVLRASHCFGVTGVFIQDGRYKRQYTDTTAAYRQIPVIPCQSLIEHTPFDCVPVCVEIRDDAESLFSYKHPRSAFYIFGPEDGSVPNHISERCRDRVYIPTKFCLNLAATVNVLMYDRAAKAANSREIR